MTCGYNGIVQRAETDILVRFTMNGYFDSMRPCVTYMKGDSFTGLGLLYGHYEKSSNGSKLMEFRRVHYLPNEGKFEYIRYTLDKGHKHDSSH